MQWLMMVLALASATAFGAERDIAVAPDQDWNHAPTGLLLMSQLAGLPRTALTDATQSERDVTAKFEAPDHSLSATVYVFRPAIADAALWFDSAQTGMELSRTFHDAVPATAEPVSFAAGAARSPSSLRQVYRTPGGKYRSTGLVVVPVGEWIVSIQINARELSTDQLNGRLQQVIGAIRWPQPAGAPPPAARPVMACVPTSTKAGPAPDPGWCRDGVATSDYGVYRSNGGAAGYVLALNDSGGIVSVDPAPPQASGKNGSYVMALTDVDGNVSTFPSFAALPTPQQVWNVIVGGQR